MEIIGVVKQRRIRWASGWGEGGRGIYMEEKYVQSFGGETSKETTFKTWA